MNRPADMDRAVVLDDGILSDMVGGSGSDVVATLVEGFLEEARDRVNAISEAYRLRDSDALGFQAHALKSTAHTYGALRLGNVAATLEEAAKVPDCGVIGACADSIDDLLAETEIAFRTRFLSG
jgi:HPt (histidine-containing phosphotransfer) domain-containing protein